MFCKDRHAISTLGRCLCIFPEQLNLFNFVPVTEQNISDIIKNLKNKSSYGYDCLSNILIKGVQNVLIEPLTFFINQSLSTGIFPNELKISPVKPLYKSGKYRWSRIKTG